MGGFAILKNHNPHFATFKQYFKKLINKKIGS